MPLASLARWTPGYFTVSLAALLLAQALMVAGIGHPAASLRAPETLFVVHLVLIGWLSLAMAGALLQFVPVLIARPLAHPGLAAPALAALAGGAGLLCAAFAVLAGWLDAPLDLFLPAAALLLTGVLLLALMLARTIAGEHAAGSVAGFVLGGLACLIAAAATGSGFAVLLAGRADWLAALDWPGDRVPLHAMLGIGGWLGLVTLGVSYRLFAMFMVAPDGAVRQGGRIMALGAAGFGAILAGLGGLAPAPLAATAASVLFAAMIALYACDLVALHRQRRRKRLELNMAASLPALAALALGAAMLPPALLTQAGEPVVAATGFLLVFGWLTGLTLAQLVRIVPFITWIEVYAPVLGHRPVPRIEDLLAARRARLWFALYHVGVAAGTLALLLAQPLAFRAAMALSLAGTLGIVIELVRARRLAAIADAGCRRPSLIVTAAPQRTQAHASGPA